MGRRNGGPCRLGGSIRRGISPMKHPLAAALAVAMAIAAPAYAQDAAMPDKAATASAADPFAADSPLPLHYTQFDKISDSDRSEEHTSELKPLMRISYAVFCLKKTT